MCGLCRSAYPVVHAKFAALLKNLWGIELLDCQYERRFVGERQPYKVRRQFTLGWRSPLNGLRCEARFFSVRHAFYALPRMSRPEFLMYLNPKEN